MIIISRPRALLFTHKQLQVLYKHYYRLHHNAESTQHSTRMLDLILTYFILSIDLRAGKHYSIANGSVLIYFILSMGRLGLFNVSLTLYTDVPYTITVSGTIMMYIPVQNIVVAHVLLPPGSTIRKHD